MPGLKVDHLQVDFERLYPADQVVTLDEEGLRKALEELPCCTYDKKGEEKGDPLNLVFIGNPDEIYYTLIRAGWDETVDDIRCLTMENGDVFSLRRSLPLFSRQCALRFWPSAGRRLPEGPQLDPRRNHLRIWLAPMRYEGKMVWAGQISRDIWSFSVSRLKPSQPTRSIRMWTRPGFS